jgi:hypothetical protein
VDAAQTAAQQPSAWADIVRAYWRKRDWLLGRVADKPDLTLQELRAELSERGRCMLRPALAALGCRRHQFQNKPCAPASKIAQTSPGGVNAGSAQHLLDAISLVFIDETWAKTNMAPTRGRCPRGKRLVAKVPHGRWRTMTFVAALRCDRVEAPCLVNGPINGTSSRPPSNSFWSPPSGLNAMLGPQVEPEEVISSWLTGLSSLPAGRHSVPSSFESSVQIRTVRRPNLAKGRSHELATIKRTCGILLSSSSSLYRPSKQGMVPPDGQDLAAGWGGEPTYPTLNNRVPDARQRNRRHDGQAERMDDSECAGIESTFQGENARGENIEDDEAHDRRIAPESTFAGPAFRTPTLTRAACSH